MIADLVRETVIVEVDLIRHVQEAGRTHVIDVTEKVSDFFYILLLKESFLHLKIEKKKQIYNKFLI